MKKGRKYGTILVDLERHAVVDLLPDRTSDVLEEWLKAHPGVELITRDRSGSYSEGATRGAPKAIQIADRFHLLKVGLAFLLVFIGGKMLAVQWIHVPTQISLMVIAVILSSSIVASLLIKKTNIKA